MGHERLDLLQRHAFLDRSFHPDQADPVLIFEELADRANPPIPQIIDIVDGALRVFEADEVFDRLEDIFPAQGALLERNVGEAELQVELEAADFREVVMIRAEEEIVEKLGGHLEGGGIAGAQPPIDLDEGVFAGVHLVQEQGVAKGRTDVLPLDVQQFDGLHLPPDEISDHLLGDGVVAFRNDLAGAEVDHILGQDPPDEFAGFDRQPADADFLQLLERLLAELPVLLDQDFAGFGVENVLRRPAAHQDLRVQFLVRLDLIADKDPLTGIESVEEFFRGVPKGFEEYRYREFAASVDAVVQNVLGIEFQIEPRPAKRNDARGIEDLPAGMGLAPVVIEENTRRTMQLAHHHPFRAVDDKGPVVGHQGQGPEIDILFLDVANGFLAGLLVDVVDHQADHDLQRRLVGHASCQAFLDVVLHLPEAVLHKLQRRRATEVFNGKDTLEDFLESLIAPGFRRDILLQKLIVAFFLHLNQVRDVDDSVNLSERLPQPIFVS